MNNVKMQFPYKQDKQTASYGLLLGERAIDFVFRKSSRSVLIIQKSGQYCLFWLVLASLCHFTFMDKDLAIT